MSNHLHHYPQSRQMQSTNMKNLWHKEYGFTYIKYSPLWISHQQLHIFIDDTIKSINEIQSDDSKEDVNSLLLIYSGHGGMDKNCNHNQKDIICSNGEGISLLEIQNKYASLDGLKNKQKIFFIDSCRGMNLDIPKDKIKAVTKRT